MCITAKVEIAYGNIFKELKTLLFLPLLIFIVT